MKTRGGVEASGAQRFTWPVSWVLALASLRHRPLRTLLTALGIAVAVGSTVVFLSLGEGLRQVFADQLAGLGPDIQVSFGAPSAAFFPTSPELPAEYLSKLEAEAERFGISRVTPLLLYLRGGFSPTQSFIIEGLPLAEPLSAVFPNISVVEGRSLDAADAGGAVAVVGKAAADRGGLGIGSVLRLNPENHLSIVGVVQASGGLLDNLIIVPIATLQNVMGVDDRYSLLALDLEDPARATEAARAIETAYPELTAQTQSEMYDVLQDSLRISDAVRLGISAIALLVGAIAVANTMMMSVFERTREFGVVRAVGAKPRFLFGLVLSEAVLLSLAGAAAGVLVGWLGVEIVNRVAMHYLSLEVAAITPRLVGFAVLIALVMGLVSGLLPAGRAARIPIAVAVARE